MALVILKGPLILFGVNTLGRSSRKTLLRLWARELLQLMVPTAKRTDYVGIYKYSFSDWPVYLTGVPFLVVINSANVIASTAATADLTGQVFLGRPWTEFAT